MRINPLLGLIFALVGAAILVTSAASQSTNQVSEIDRDLMQKVGEILRECEKLTPGMTRADLSKAFTPDGGIYTATHQRYVSRRCRYIKVDVEFEAKSPEQNAADKPQAEAGHGTLERKPTDVIKKVSQPYLQWAFID
jgi:hypothetical protein